MCGVFLGKGLYCLYFILKALRVSTQWLTITLRRSNCTAVLLSTHQTRACVCRSHWRHTFSFLTLAGLSPVIEMSFLRVCTSVSDESDTYIMPSAFRQVSSVAHHVLVTWTTSWFKIVTFWLWSVGQQCEKLMVKNPLFTSGVYTCHGELNLFPSSVSGSGSGQDSDAEFHGLKKSLFCTTKDTPGREKL